MAGMQLGRSAYSAVLPHDSETEATSRFVCATTVSGIVCATAVTPGERLKVLLQSANQRVGIVHAVRSIISGGRQSVFRGWTATVAREIPGCTLWFAAFEGTTAHMTRSGYAREQAVIGGAVAAGATWSFASLPFDRIKTMQQAAAGGASVSAGTLIKHIWRQQGLRGFFVGLLPGLARNVAIDIIQFTAADGLRRTLFSTPLLPAPG